MPQSSELTDTTQQFQDKLEEIRTIFRLHAYHTGHPEDLAGLPLRISQDGSLRADLVEIVRSLQRSGLHLPDVLDILVIAVAGNTASRNAQQLAEPLSLLGGFLANVGRWPGAESQPILAPGEIPANIQKFTRPQTLSQTPPQTLSQTPSARPQLTPRPDPTAAAQPQLARRPDPPAPVVPIARAPAQPPAPPAAPPRFAVFSTKSEKPAAPPVPAAEPAANPGDDDLRTDILPAAEIGRALARLERGNLELRAHLESIDQRISRMEPLLEDGTLPTDSAAAAEAPFSTGNPAPSPRSAWPIHPEAASTRQPERTPDLRDLTRSEVRQMPSFPLEPSPTTEDRPFPSPSGRTRGPVVAEAPIPAELTRSTRSASEPPATVPRFSRFSREPDAAETQISDLTPQPAPTPEAAPRRSVPLPRGFFGTAPDLESQPDPALVALPETPAPRRPRILLILAVLLVLGLAIAAFFYWRNSSPAASVNGGSADGAISSSPAPRPAIPRPSAARPADTSVAQIGPLTSSPARNTANRAADPSVDRRTGRVLGARSALQPSQSIEEPNSGGDFRPAGTFVPASVMDGRLVSAPRPEPPRAPVPAGIRSMVILEANISSLGEVEDLNILGGDAALRPAAIEAVRHWRYRPYVLNGAPVEVRTIVRVDFNQHQPQSARTSDTISQ